MWGTYHSQKVSEIYPEDYKINVEALERFSRRPDCK